MSRSSTSEFIQAMTVSVSCLCPRLASRASTRRAAADNALSSTTFALGQQAALEAGYNVVAPGYALAPQNPYPVPTVQLSQAVEFLKEHGAEYGIDMNRLVIEGGSAGGYIAAQYALIQSNPDYAARTGIEQTIDPDALQAVVLDSAPLDTEDLATEAPSLSDDFVFDFAARAFWGPPCRPWRKRRLSTMSLPPILQPSSMTATSEPGCTRHSDFLIGWINSEYRHSCTWCRAVKQTYRTHTSVVISSHGSGATTNRSSDLSRSLSASR